MDTLESKLSVAIADDNERILRLLEEIVSNDEELQVVGTAKDGEAAYKMIKEKEPDVVLLDIVMPKLDGLGVLDKIYKDFEDNNGSYYSLIEEYAYDYIDELSRELRKKEKEVER